MKSRNLGSYEGLPIVAIRLTPPALPDGEIPRHRLLNKMISNEQKSSIFVVTAPAGYGKSSLLAQCFKSYFEKGWRTGWLTIEEGDNSGDQFYYYLNALIESISDGEVSKASLLNESSAQSSGRGLIYKLINLVGGSDKKFAIFLDDYHSIEEKTIHDDVSYLLNHLPDNILVFIGSRAPIPFRLAKLKATNKLCSFDSLALCFDRDEAKSLLNNVNNQLVLSDGNFNQVYDKTGGWPAVLQLAAISIKGADNQSEFVNSFTGTDDPVDEFLAEEILELMPDETADFLLRSSILERFCPPLCDAVNGIDNSGIRLEDVDYVRLLVQRQGGESYWFQLHPVFRGFLLRQLQYKYPLELNDLYHRASLWFEEQGIIGSAIKYAIEGKDESRAMELLEEQGLRLLQIGSLPLMLSLISRLPHNLVQQSHSLLHQLIWLEILGHRFSQAKNLLGKLKSLLEKDKEANEVEWSAFYAVTAFLYCIDEKFNEMSAIVDKWLPVVSEKTSYVTTAFRVVKVFGSLSNFDFDTARDEIAHIRNTPETPEFIVSHAYASCQEALLHYNEGELLKAVSLLEVDKKSMLNRVDSHSSAVHIIREVLDSVRYITGSDESNTQKIQSDSESWDMLATVDMMLAIIPVQVSKLISSGNYVLAERYLVEQHEKALNRGWSRLDACILHERVKLGIDSNNTEKSLSVFTDWTSEGKKYSTLSKSQVEQIEEWLSIAKARLALAEGDGVKAAVITKALIEKCSHQGRLLRQLKLSVLLARIYVESGKVDRSKEVLLEALLLDQELSIIQPFRDEGKGVLKVMQLLLDEMENESLNAINSEKLQQIKQILKPFAGEKIHAVKFQTETEIAPEIESEIKDSTPYSQMVESLTKRELATLRFLVDGYTNREISDKLFISPSTVKTHLRHSYDKLGVARRTQAVRRLKELGLFS